MKNLLPAILLIFCCGCPSTMEKFESPRLEYIKSDIAFYSLTGQRLVDYIEQDENLTATQKAALIGAVSDWAFSINVAAEQHQLPQVIVPAAPEVLVE